MLFPDVREQPLALTWHAQLGHLHPLLNLAQQLQAAEVEGSVASDLGRE